MGDALTGDGGDYIQCVGGFEERPHIHANVGYQSQNLDLIAPAVPQVGHVDVLHSVDYPHH